MHILARGVVLRDLSPRVRGNRSSASFRTPCPRSIPACAGEPPLPELILEPMWVYPRVCGGTILTPFPVRNARGLSPRVRGNPAAPQPEPPRSGSIPACAGEPYRNTAHDPIPPVYPRVCGGTYQEEGIMRNPQGLSSRVRGNLRSVKCTLPIGRSIPACAGEPA